jgi:aminoglycoside phosphotransferase (APT) family kinase protein
MLEPLKATMAQALGLPPATLGVFVRQPLDHQTNRLYDLWAGDRHLIVKEFMREGELEEMPVREYRALELLAPLEIAPRPVLFRPASSPTLGPLVVYEFMEGEMWDRCRPSGTALAQLAEIWQKMHPIAGGDLGMPGDSDRPLDEIAARFRTRFQAYAAWVDSEWPAGQPAAGLCQVALETCLTAINELADCDPVLCFCHGDPRFANVIQRPDGRLGLVDWEDSGLRDPARDLAALLTHPNQEDLLSPDDWQAFLQPYLAARTTVDPGLLRRMYLYLVVTSVWGLSLLVSQGVDRAGAGEPTNWTVNGLPAHRRLQRYLARALAGPQLDFSSQIGTAARVRFFP